MDYKIKEKIYKLIFTLLAFSSLFFLVSIVWTLFINAISIFHTVTVKEFLTGTHWYPTSQPASFGILPLILGTLWVTAGAMILSVPLGVGSALFLHELADNKTRSLLKPLIEILAGIPSVVFGFFGVVIAAPFVKQIFNLPIGLCALTASIILGIMAVPTICSLSEDALSYVPKNFREASLALGATKWQTLIKVVIPAAGSGISTAIILGMSRIIGETMTVLMVSGGAAMIPHSFTDAVRPMTSTIAAEMGEAPVGSDHYSALFGIGLILFLITLVLNLIAEMISRRFRLKLGISQ